MIDVVASGTEGYFRRIVISIVHVSSEVTVVFGRASRTIMV